MSEAAELSRIGIYGGTFDPIHYGHLRVAEELTGILQLDLLYFLPAGQPRLRNAPVAPGNDRIVMLREAIRGNAGFLLDDREIRRPGETYSVESLYEMQREYGKNKPIAFCFIMGVDTFLKLPDWHRWRELFELCHLIVVGRPGYAPITDQSSLSPELEEICRDRWTVRAEELKNVSSGLIFTAPTTLLDISSTKIRTLIASGQSARYLLPDNVLTYINMHNFYAGGK